MPKILVTGANGQLGSELKEWAEKTGMYQFRFTDVDTLNLTDEKAIENALLNQSYHYLINCAAYTAVDKAESDIQTARLINATTTKYLAQACTKHKVKLIHISTDFVFKGNHHKPLLENETTEPEGIYGITKLEGEQFVEQFAADATIIRTSWLYSTYGNNFVKTIQRLAGERKQLTVIFDQIGTPTNAADLADAIMQMIQLVEEKKAPYVPGIYHYSNEGVASWYDFAMAIVELSHLNCTILPIPASDYPLPAPRPHFSVMNKGKIKATYGITIPYWRDSLKNMIHKNK